MNEENKVNTEENSDIVAESQARLYEILLKHAYERGVLMGALYGVLGLGIGLWVMALAERLF